MITYENTIKPNLKNFIYIKISDDKIKKINDFVTNLVEAKKKESHHIIDSNSVYKRFYTGILGEAALEELFNKQLIDWTIGHSNNYHQADLRKIGLNVGVKTVELGKFPIIFKKSYYPEIIILKSSDNEVYVCGLAEISVLNNYQDVNLILDKKLRERGTKTGFYGFDKLRRFSSINQLESLL